MGISYLTREYIINFAFIYSLLLSILLMSYSYKIGLLQTYFLVYCIFGLILIIYCLGWYLDKKGVKINVKRRKTSL